MQVTDKGQVTIPKRLRDAAAKVRKSLDEPFKQMNSDDIMAFLRPDGDDCA